MRHNGISFSSSRALNCICICMMHSKPWHRSVIVRKNWKPRCHCKDQERGFMLGTYICTVLLIPTQFLYLSSQFPCPASFFPPLDAQSDNKQSSSPSVLVPLSNKTGHQFPFSFSCIKGFHYLIYPICYPGSISFLDLFPCSTFWTHLSPTYFISCSSRTYQFPVLLLRCSIHNLLRISVVARKDSKGEERALSSRLLSLLKLVKKANFLVNGRRNNLWLAFPNYNHESPSATQRQLSKYFNVGKIYIFFFFKKYLMYSWLFYTETNARQGKFPTQWLKTGKIIISLRYGLIMEHVKWL